MTGGIRMLLCVLAAGWLLSSQAGSQPCSPPSDPSARVGLRGYRRFHANDSLIGRPVPCTRDDKTCFRHNLILHPQLGRCEPISHVFSNCTLRVNRTELEHGSGRLVGICPKYIDPCPGYRMAYDDLCYRKEIVRDVICGCEGNPAYHILGNVECRRAPAIQISIQQPEEDGRCVIPDLRFPDEERSHFFYNPFQATNVFVSYNEFKSYEIGHLKCEGFQAECFSKKKVWVSGKEGCHTLLKQGPCPVDHVVAMNLQAAMTGQAEATCVHSRGGCPPGSKRMVFDGECHEDRQIKIEAPGTIQQNPFGGHMVVLRSPYVTFSPILTNQTCHVINSFVSGGIARPYLYPPCGADDKGGCGRYEVINERPIPEE